jgi:hypothetical protein
MTHNGDSLLSPCPEFAKVLKAVLALLLQAHESATAAQRDRWQFAMEIWALKEASLNNNHLRYLICQGYVEHRLEQTPSGAEKRSFRSSCRLMLRETSCFLLSEAGLKFARNLRLDVADVQLNGGPHGAVATPALIPEWDPDRRELRLGRLVAKRFRQPARNQETILAVFQEDGWPPRIDNPLSGHGGTNAVDRLHSAVKKLNHNTHAFLRFRSDGNGLGVQWELAGVAEPGAVQERPRTGP